MIKFRCPHCNQKLGVPDNYANRRIRCNKCNEPSRVPAAAQIQTPPSAKSQSAAASTRQHRMNAEEFLAPTKQDSVKIPLQRSPKAPEPAGDILDIDELEEVDDEARRLEAVQQARKLQQQQRASAVARKTKNRIRQKSDSDSGGGFHFPVLTDFVPEVLRLPLGLAAGVAGAAIMIGIWVAVSRATSNALGFAALLVPLAGSTGIRLFVSERTFLWALTATAIGALGIAAGKAAIVKHVAIPYYHEQVNKEVLVDLKSLLADEKYQLEPGQSAKFFAQDGDFMQCIALISLVDDGLADPIAVRKWVMHILLASNKTNIYAYLMSKLGSGPEAPAMPDMQDEDESMFAQASERLWNWAEEELELRKARQYFPALNCISGQANLKRMLENPDAAFKFAFLDTLGLFDILWVLLGMGLGYVSLALD